MSNRLDQLHRLERLAHDHAAGLAAEKLIERAVVDRDRPVPGLHVHAGGGGLAAARAVVRLWLLLRYG